MLLELGEIFEGKFRIDELLGEGGYAVVYAATDLSLQRPVALKLLRPDAGDDYAESTRGRFRREIQAVAKLKDAHTVTMFEHGVTDDGLLYVVFEQVPGRDLAEALAQAGRLEPDVVEHLLRQLLSSLREAHHHDLIHRDIKPENIRVFDAGDDPWCVKLLDFGIARPSKLASVDVTATGELVGTPRYMSPEQLTDRPLTPASDIYSLGLVAFETLAGSSSLHGGGWHEQLQRLRSGHLLSAPGAEHAAGGLHDIVRKMTARRVEDRFASADEVLDALDALRHGETHALQPAVHSQSATNPLQRPPGRAPSLRLLAAAAAAGLAVVATLGAIAIWLSQEEPPTPVVRPKVPRALLATPKVDLVAAPEEPPIVDAGDASVEPRPDLSRGCGGEESSGLRTIRWSDGFERYEGLVYVPRGYDPHRPHAVIGLLHEARQTAAQMFEEAQMQELANEEGIILVMPEGRLHAITLKGVQSAAKPWVESKWRRASRMLLSIDQRLCVDRDRVFVVGHGQGAKVGQFIACEGGIAAYANVAFRDNARARDACPGSHVPQLVLAPLADPAMPVDGGGPQKHCPGEIVVSLVEYEDILRARHGCRGERSVVDRHTGGTCHTWTCEVPLWSCHMEGGGHWPGYEPDSKCPFVPSKFPRNEVIWDFFSRVTERP